MARRKASPRLERAAKRAAEVAKPRRSWHQTTTPTYPALRRVTREDQHAWSFAPTKKRQRQLFTATVRPETVEALKAAPSARKRNLVLRDEALRRAICADYKRQTKARRETMFATGSAGKARRNPGPRKRDWRAGIC